MVFTTYSGQHTRFARAFTSLACNTLMLRFAHAFMRFVLTELAYWSAASTKPVYGLSPDRFSNQVVWHARVSTLVLPFLDNHQSKQYTCELIP